MFYLNRSSERVQLNSVGHQTWKSFAGLQKKAMEQEFTWSGFIISLSIAFFIVGTSSATLNALYLKFEPTQPIYKTNTTKIYILEKAPAMGLVQYVNC